MNSDESPLEIRTFDPVVAFEQTLHDLYEIIEAFQADDTGAMDAMTFLKASKTAEDRLRAISTMTVTGLMQSVGNKIPDEVRIEFESQIRLDELMESPEDKQRKMLEILKDITKRQQ